ncbi:MAG: hypothetical protein OHK0015_31270 [Chloroflexi bacterium OHK40]
MSARSKPSKAPDASTSALLEELAACRRALAEEQAARQAAEARLVAATQREHLLQRTLPYLVWIKDVEGRYLFVSDAMLDFHGRRREEVLGRTANEALSPEASEIIQGCDEQVLCTGRAYTNELLTRDHTGQPVWLITLRLPIHGPGGSITGIAGFSHEITARRRAEEELRHHQVLLAAILDYAPVAVALQDTEGRFLLANPPMAEALATTPETIPGHTADDYFPPEIAAIWHARRRSVVEHRKPLQFEDEVLSPDTKTRTALATLFPIFDAAGHVVSVGAIYLDISTRRAAEEALARRARYAHALARCSQALLAETADESHVEQVVGTALHHLLGAAHASRIVVYQTPGPAAASHLFVATGGPPMSPEPHTLHPDVAQRLSARHMVSGPWAGLVAAPLAPAEAEQRTMLVPVHLGARWWGYLAISGASERPWDADEAQGLQTAAEMVASFLQRRETTDTLRRRIGELLILNQIAQALATWQHLEHEIEAISVLVQRLFESPAVAIWSYVEGEARLHPLAMVGCAASPDARTAPLAGSPTLRQIFAQRTPRVLQPGEDVLSQLCHPADASVPHAVLLTPLLVYGTPVGLLGIAARHPGQPFGVHDLTLAQTVASTLAAAIDNSRLLATEQQQRRLAENLRRIAIELARDLDQQALVKGIFTHLRRVLPYDGAAVFLREGAHLLLIEGVGLAERFRGSRVKIANHSILQRIVRERRPYLVRDTHRNHSWVPWSDDEAIRSGIGVPLIFGSKTFGVLTIDSLAVQAYSEDDVATLEAFATHAAIAIDNARRYGEAGREAAEGERRRIARDLHDSVSQALLAATRTARVLPQLWELDPEEARAAMGDLVRLTESAQAEMRALLLELRPAALARTPLHEALNNLVGTLAAKSGAKVRVSLERTPPLSPDVHIALYRIAQEALNNVVRHAHACRVTIRLGVVPPASADEWYGTLTLEVSDDGRGFEPGANYPGGFGLESIHERAAGIGAALLITSQPDAGTTVTVSWTRYAPTYREGAPHE